MSRNIPQNIWEEELSYISAKLEGFACEHGEEKLIGLMSRRIKQLESYIYRSSLTERAPLLPIAFDVNFQSCEQIVAKCVQSSK